MLALVNLVGMRDGGSGVGGVFGYASDGGRGVVFGFVSDCVVNDLPLTFLCHHVLIVVLVLVINGLMMMRRSA
jgi:hypothetical protein